MASERYSDAVRVWQRHARARQLGVPIVSVLIGEPDGFEAALERDFVWSNAAALDAVAGDWWRQITARRDLAAEAFRCIARTVGAREAELEASWRARSERERRLWLAQSETPALSGALALLRDSLEADPSPGDRALAVRRHLAWLPRPEGLGLRNASALRGVLSLVIEAPHLSVLAQLDESAWRAALSQLDDRSRTLLEQGLIARGVPPEVRRAETLEALRRTVAAARSARDRGAPDAVELDSRARSLAEQRLYDLLQQDPVTRDLFRLNERLPFTFGNAHTEVDLACIELRLAVEVDGYFHFLGPAAYRRDRRKDVLLQHQGYLVSRHLAEDVEQRAGEVVRAIRELVKRRRRSRRRENAT